MIDTSVICHVFLHFWGSFLLKDMFWSLQVPAFEGKNMRFTVKMLLIILWRRARLWLELFASTVGRFLSWKICPRAFSLERQQPYFKWAICFFGDIVMFLAAIWSSWWFSSSMYRFIPPFGRSGTTWFKCSCLCATLNCFACCICHCSA